MTTTAPSSLTIRSVQGDYAVRFEDRLDEVVRHVLTFRPSAVLLIDRRVAEMYRTSLAPLEGIPARVVEATEDEKTLTGVTRVVQWLQEQRCTRQTVVIALGGGILQDIATFSSHIYYRGLRWVLI